MILTRHLGKVVVFALTMSLASCSRSPEAEDRDGTGAVGQKSEFDALTPVQHLARARKLIRSPSPPDRFEQAEQHLNAIPSTAPERKTADTLLPVLHIEAAEALVSDSPSPDSFEKALVHLAAVPANSPERKRADSLVASVRQKKKESEEAKKIERARDLADQAAEARESVKLEREARVEFAKGLRNGFLDEGKNIKVNTSGKDNTTLHLEYPLFDDVWAHHFRKGSLIRDIWAMGFARIRLSNGFDYSTPLVFENH